MKKIKNLFEFYQKMMTPKEFLKAYEDVANRSNIESIDIIPSRLGGNSFGKITVTYRYPEYK